MILPRLIRAGQAPAYLGMSRDRFDADVRPFVKSAKLGKQGVVFDRLDLDRFADQYMDSNGRRPDEKGVLCGKTQLLDSASARTSGTSTVSLSKDMDRFSKALARAIQSRQHASAMK